MGSDCTGMGARHFAMKGLRASFSNKFTSDILPESNKFIKHIIKPEKIYTDMLARKPEDEDEVDVYLFTPLPGLVSSRQAGWLQRQATSG